jgi:hypothetical protein
MMCSTRRWIPPSVLTGSLCCCSYANLGEGELQRLQISPISHRRPTRSLMVALTRFLMVTPAYAAARFDVVMGPPLVTQMLVELWVGSGIDRGPGKSDGGTIIFRYA